MSTITESVEYILSFASNDNDKKIANYFHRYAIGNIESDMLCSDFGNIEFLKYHAFLVANKPHKAVYVHCVAMRRLMSQAHIAGYEFKTNPSYFDVPPKPNPSHFEPLNDEQLDKLTNFLEREIDVMIKKEDLFQKAKLEGKLISETGADFKKSPVPPLPLLFITGKNHYRIAYCNCIVKPPGILKMQRLDSFGSGVSMVD